MIYFKNRGARYAETWFGEEPSSHCGVDICSYRQVAAPVRGTRARPFRTLVTELSADADQIIHSFGKNCRQKINRAHAKDRLQLEFIREPASKLDEFREFYDNFAKQKALRAIDRRWLASACQAGQFALASALQDGERLVWHGYLVAGDFGWLQYSASAFRDRDGDYRSLVGRANRWLHWQSMLQFKGMGLANYDWGGIFEDESTAERAGINRFKREFRGVEVRRYDCVRPITLRGRMRISLNRLADRYRSLRTLSGSVVGGNSLPRRLRILLDR